MPLPIDWAHATWAAFREKFKELIDEQPLKPQLFEGGEPKGKKNHVLRVIRRQAAQKIITWWKKQRNSGRSIPINPKGNHSQAFRTYLNGKTLKKRLSSGLDKIMLYYIKQGTCWNDPSIFQDQDVILSILNLFASGKITWQQKATLSSIIEAQNSFGPFKAYSIVDETGSFSIDARRLLLPFLHKGFPSFPNNDLNDEDRDKFLALVNTLPLSEQYFFVFPDQKTDGLNSLPSLHNRLRETVSNAFLQLPGTRLLKVNQSEFPQYRNIPSMLINTMSFNYTGILKLSFGAENALGLAGYGIQDWFTLIPILGEVTINEIDFFGQKYAKPMISSDSIALGLLQSSPITHGSTTVLSDVEAHDLYHGYVSSRLGKHIYDGIQRIIQVTRQTVGFKWSKDLWVLRNGDLLTQFGAKKLLNKASFSQEVYITKCFVSAILTPYLAEDLENCTPEIQRNYANGRSIMLFSPYNGEPHSFFPHQVALAFLIDLVKNPDIWDTYHIVANEDYFEAPYLALLRMTKFLYAQQLFNDEMKGNILKMEAFLKTQEPLINGPLLYFVPSMNRYSFLAWETPQGESAKQLASNTKVLFEKIDAELPTYYPCRDNRTVFLGFRKMLPVKQNDQNNAQVDENIEEIKKLKIN